MFRISCAEAHALRGMHRRAAAIYRDAALNWNLTNKEIEEALRRSHALLYQAEQCRKERAKQHGYTNDFDISDFNGAYNGCSSNITLWGQRSY